MKILFDVDGLTEEQKEQVLYNLTGKEGYKYNGVRSTAHKFSDVKNYEVFPVGKIIAAHDYYLVTPNAIVIRVK